MALLRRSGNGREPAALLSGGWPPRAMRRVMVGGKSPGSWRQDQPVRTT